MSCISKPSGAGRWGGSQSDTPHWNAYAKLSSKRVPEGCPADYGGGLGLKAPGFMVQIKKAILGGVREPSPRTNINSQQRVS
jgi:hypothetical protein